MEKERATELSRELACALDQHEWIIEDDDIRFRVCIHCGVVQYKGKEVKKRAKPRKYTQDVEDD